jgi:acetyltransferase-like isoleucine patch superfamily enzyme
MELSKVKSEVTDFYDKIGEVTDDGQAWISDEIDAQYYGNKDGGHPDVYQFFDGEITVIAKIIGDDVVISVDVYGIPEEDYRLFRLITRKKEITDESS